MTDSDHLMPMARHLGRSRFSIAEGVGLVRGMIVPGTVVHRNLDHAEIRYDAFGLHLSDHRLEPSLDEERLVHPNDEQGTRLGNSQQRLKRFRPQMP